jgi:putative chitinase
VPSLQEGSKGSEVTVLQRKLKAKGFNPGKIDGVFGLGTEAAVLAFQRSEGLLADGIVGPQTAKALALPVEDGEPAAPGVTVSVVSRMFPHTPLGPIKKNLPDVLSSLSKAKLDDKPMVLMALSTIRAETEGFEPIPEGLSRYNTSPAGHPFDLYDNRKDLGNQGPPDGERFRGRGYVQLTGRFNYKKYGQAIGLGERLVSQPQMACDSVTAANLLAAFIKDKERAIREALLVGALSSARRLVNGGVHGLDRFTDAFKTGDALIV